jgi:aminoglycoside N3'-acetyltransferase
MTASSAANGPRDRATLDAVERTADDVLLPLTGTTLRSALTLPPPSAGVELRGEALALSTVKESESGEWLVVRCVNVSDGTVAGEWQFGLPVSEARLARLDETPLSALTPRGGLVPFTAPPRGVVTVLVRFGPPDDDRSEVGRAELTAQLRRLGVQDAGVLLVHTSYRAVRPVEGGPGGLIAALRDALGPGGTLVMPSWGGDDDAPFDAATTPAARDLGVVADTFWRLPGVVRSAHFFAFAAAGPAAARITADPLPLPPHQPASPVGRVHELDGQVLLLGVGHDANTTLHLAELLAGVPYRAPKHCTVLGPDRRPVRVDYGENDHCCQRFALADEWLRARGLQREGRVGHATARLLRARDVTAVACEHLARDPLVFLHAAGSGCVECEEARQSVGGAG